MCPSRIERTTHISTTRGNAVPQGTPLRSAAPRTTSFGVVAGLLVLLVGGALATAGPAAAAEDTSHPVVRVVKGPSCSPGGMVFDVVARTTPYSVRLATTRTPAGEDSGTVQPGATLRLRGADVAYGETVDSRLEYTALDGSGTSYVDELDDWTMTRPSKADCDAVAAPSPADSSAGTAASSAPASSASSSAAAPASTGEGSAGPPSPLPGTPAPERAAADRNAGSATVTAIDAGGAFTLLGAGFQPGERVTVHLHGSGDVLGVGHRRARRRGARAHPAAHRLDGRRAERRPGRGPVRGHRRGPPAGRGGPVAGRPPRHRQPVVADRRLRRAREHGRRRWCRWWAAAGPRRGSGAPEPSARRSAAAAEGVEEDASAGPRD